jgi:hypothetical protein
MSLFPDGLGWLATAVFAVSYACNATKLRLVQAAAALIWMAYGVMIHATPVIVANLIVSSLALYSAWRAAENREAASKYHRRGPGDPLCG